MKRLFIVCLFVGLLAALAANGNEERGTAGSDPIDLHIMRGVHVTDVPGNVDVNDNPWVNIYKEKFPNYNVTWEIVPGGTTEYNTKKNLVMASGDMPDLIQCSATDMVLWADQELILPMDDYLEDYAPEWLANVEGNNSKYLGMYKGKQYNFVTPQIPMQNGRHQFIRKDWLENLGLEQPKNTEELLTVLKAFTFDDPDGNGKDDTYGMSGIKGLVHMDQLTYPFDIDFTFWSDVDGTIVPDIIRPEAKDALAFIRECYEAGVIEPDAFVLSFGDYWARCRQWYYGYINFYKNGVINVANPKLGSDIPGAAYTLMNPPVEGPEGVQRLSVGAWNYWNWAVPVTTEHPAEITEVFNFSYTEEGDEFFLGTEGVQYEDVGGFKYTLPRSDSTEQWRQNFATTLSLEHTKSAEAWIESWTVFAENGKTSMEYPEGIELFAKYGDYNDYVIPSTVEADKMPDLKTYFEEISVDIVLGNKPLSAFDDWVDYFYANGGNDVIEDVNLKNK